MTSISENFADDVAILNILSTDTKQSPGICFEKQPGDVFTVTLNFASSCQPMSALMKLQVTNCNASSAFKNAIAQKLFAIMRLKVSDESKIVFLTLNKIYRSTEKETILQFTTFIPIAADQSGDTKRSVVSPAPFQAKLDAVQKSSPIEIKSPFVSLVGQGHPPSPIDEIGGFIVKDKDGDVKVVDSRGLGLETKTRTTVTTVEAVDPLRAAQEKIARLEAKLNATNAIRVDQEMPAKTDFSTLLYNESENVVQRFSITTDVKVADLDVADEWKSAIKTGTCKKVPKGTAFCIVKNPAKGSLCLRFRENVPVAPANLITDLGLVGYLLNEISKGFKSGKFIRRADEVACLTLVEKLPEPYNADLWARALAHPTVKSLIAEICKTDVGKNLQFCLVQSRTLDGKFSDKIELKFQNTDFLCKSVQYEVV